MEPFFAPGGMRVVDTATRTTRVSGRRSGIEDWRGWCTAVDGRTPSGFLGHDPDPLVERHGDIYRVTVRA
jgi:hypothetical protein